MGCPGNCYKPLHRDKQRNYFVIAWFRKLDGFMRTNFNTEGKFKRSEGRFTTRAIYN